MDSKSLSKNVVFEGKHFRIVHEQVDVGNGHVQTFEYAWRRDGTRVIAIRRDHTVLLAHEYRFELNGRDWRLPGGKLDTENEPPEVAAAREFEEETGFRAQRLEHLHVTTPFATVRYGIHFFLTFEPVQSTQRLEAGENLELSWVPLSQAVSMALNRQIQEDISALAIIRVATDLVTERRTIPTRE